MSIIHNEINRMTQENREQTALVALNSIGRAYAAKETAFDPTTVKALMYPGFSDYVMLHYYPGTLTNKVVKDLLDKTITLAEAGIPPLEVLIVTPDTAVTLREAAEALIEATVIVGLVMQALAPEPEPRKPAFSLN